MWVNKDLKLKIVVKKKTENALCKSLIGFRLCEGLMTDEGLEKQNDDKS